MITSWDIYWITRLDAISAICEGGVVLSLLLLAVWGLCMGPIEMWGDNEEGRPLYLRLLRYVSVALVVFTLLASLTPNTKQFAAIYLVPKIANNEQVQKLPDNAMKFLNGKLEEWISGLGESKKKK